MTRTVCTSCALLMGLVASGCANQKPRQPSFALSSTASTQSVDTAADGQSDIALAIREGEGGIFGELLREPWGWRRDRNDVFHFPLTQADKWKRVRFWGVPAFTAFRYGDSHRAMAVMFVRRLPAGAKEDLNLCFDRMEQWAQPLAESYETTYRKGKVSYVSWKSTDDVAVLKVDAEVRALFSKKRYLGVVGLTFGWPGVCVAYGYVFRVQGDEALAQAVRDRYAQEAFSRLTVYDPLRRPDGVDDLP